MEGGKAKWVGKVFEVIFDDGRGISKRVGVITGEDQNFIYLRDTWETDQVINKSRIIRISEIKDSEVKDAGKTC